MIPLRDNIPSETTPVVNYGLILLNILAFAYQLLWHGRDAAYLVPLTHPLFDAAYKGPLFLYDYALVPAKLAVDLTAGGDPTVLVPALALPFISYMFLHGSLLHLLGNMLFLWIYFGNI